MDSKSFRDMQVQTRGEFLPQPLACLHSAIRTRRLGGTSKNRITGAASLVASTHRMKTILTGPETGTGPTLRVRRPALVAEGSSLPVGNGQHLGGLSEQIVLNHPGAPAG